MNLQYNISARFAQNTTARQLEHSCPWRLTNTPQTIANDCWIFKALDIDFMMREEKDAPSPSFLLFYLSISSLHLFILSFFVYSLESVQRLEDIDLMRKEKVPETKRVKQWNSS